MGSEPAVSPLSASALALTTGSTGGVGAVGKDEAASSTNATPSRLAAASVATGATLAEDATDRSVAVKISAVAISSALSKLATWSVDWAPSSICEGTAG